MERIWDEKSLDLPLTPYAVVPTMSAAGLIEVVPDAGLISFKTVFYVPHISN